MAGTQGQKGQPVARESADIIADLTERLKDVFPEAVSEGKIDFDKLRATLDDVVDTRQERYSFTWAGKRDAIQMLQVPSRAALVPATEESVNFEGTGHIFIEGENLEVLKLLYRSYFGRVKMVYIDPPYNTGNDFIFPDNFADPLDYYLKLTGQKDASGNLLTTNPETSGRYHSAWLSMMYPRLFIARQLLNEDGVVFVSIDNTELANLRLMMNEVFGEENFLGSVVRATGTTTGQDSRGFGSSFDYLLVYSKSVGYEVGGIPLSSEDALRFSEEDERGKYSILQLRKTGSADRREDRPAMYYPVTAPDNTLVYPFGPGGYESRWRVGPKTYQKWVEEKLIHWKKRSKEESEEWVPYVKYYLEGREKRPSPLWTDIDGNKKATLEIKSLLGEKVFDNPKPTALIRRILQVSTEPDTDDIVLDFFAGSCTTAHAVLQLNREDQGSRRFLMIQLPEPTPEGSPARAAGFNTISDIGKERIRRVIKRLGDEEDKLAVQNRGTQEDLGFKVFKLRESNFRLWQGTDKPEAEAYARQMALHADPLVDGWKVEDVVWEVAVKEGFGLGSQIERLEKVKERRIYRVTDPDRKQSFCICLEDKVELDAVKPLGLSSADLFICRDSAITDETAANLALQCRLKTI